MLVSLLSDFIEAVLFPSSTEVTEECITLSTIKKQMQQID